MAKDKGIWLEIKYIGQCPRIESGETTKDCCNGPCYMPDDFDGCPIWQKEKEHFSKKRKLEYTSCPKCWPEEIEIRPGTPNARIDTFSICKAPCPYNEKWEDCPVHNQYLLLRDEGRD